MVTKKPKSLRALCRGTISKTKFTSWLQANQLSLKVLNIRYINFPKYFTWTSRKYWKPRASHLVLLSNPLKLYFTRPLRKFVRKYTPASHENMIDIISVLFLHSKQVHHFMIYEPWIAHFLKTIFKHYSICNYLWRWSMEKMYPRFTSVKVWRTSKRFFP